MKQYAILVFIAALFTMLVAGSVVYAQSDGSAIDQLREKIDDRAARIQALESEIEKYEEELEEVAEEKSSLQGAIRELDLSERKLESEINVTQNRISATSFQISKLALEIEQKEALIELQSDTLAQSLRAIHEIDQRTFVETMLASESISELWEQVEDLQRFQSTLQASLFELKSLKDELLSSKEEREDRRQELLNYNQDLLEQEEAVEITKSEKRDLLSQTQNKESNYKEILEEKRAARIKFEQELLEFESQLQIAIDPNSIPNPNKNILSSPIENVRITQYFGNTAFAQSGAYDGRGHNGVDFGTPIGTRIKAPLSGVVAATGNTDAVPGCYSYGKWMLVQHNNGLSTLYAHLSNIALSEGTQVQTGQTIGYSGNTGYSTGPHLHFTVFATQGVKVVRFGDIKEITNCADASIPVAPLEAYLNPLQYLSIE